MKLGVILPTFRDQAQDALEMARRCDDVGLDGVFAYDHLWPMGSPKRPSLAPFPILAAVATRCSSLEVGPLVARVGMFGDAQLVRQFRSLASLAPGRVIAAVGTGDAKSRDELEAYGLKFSDAQVRRGALENVAKVLEEEMTVWIGAGSSATNELAIRLGVVLNVWDVAPSRLNQLSLQGPVTWAGPAPELLAPHLDALRDAGAEWAIFAPGVDVLELASWRDRGE